MKYVPNNVKCVESRQLESEQTKLQRTKNFKTWKICQKLNNAPRIYPPSTLRYAAKR